MYGVFLQQIALFRERKLAGAAKKVGRQCAHEKKFFALI
jgi:hypothetical protein